MKFKTIREFMDLVPACQFCDSPMEIKLVGKRTPVYVPSYKMTFNDTVFYTEARRSLEQAVKDTKETNAITYPSELVGDNLNYYYAIGKARGIILSINIDTGKVTGDVDRIQKVIWDHQLTVACRCSSNVCEKGYLNETSTLHLERKGKTLFPFWLDLEGIVVVLQNKTYTLLSSHSRLKTTVLYANDSEDVVKKLPVMYLHQFRGKDNILNKIKTILVFS